MKSFDLNLPNALTFSRIALIPIFILFFHLPVSWNYLAACITFIIAAVTDSIDGYYARKLRNASAFGKFLDPVADKLLVTVVLIVLLAAKPSVLLITPVILIISREIIISAWRAWMAESGVSNKADVSVYGKVKTVSQLVALGFLIFHEPLFGLPIYEIGITLLYISVVLTMWSMCLYMRVTFM